MTPYAEIEVHGTPDGYHAGCKTDSMCDPAAPWSCRRAVEKYRGDYAYHRRVDQGLTPHAIAELEAQEAEVWEQKPVPAKPKKTRKGSRLPLVDVATGPITKIAPERLAAYGANATAAHQRIASAPTPTTSAAALAATPSKENPMSRSITLPEGVVRRDPPARAMQRRARGASSRNLQLIAAMKASPREWLCLGVAGKDAVQRWRHGKIAGATKGEFEAVIDLPNANATKGDVYVRYIGKAAAVEGDTND